MSGKEFAKWMDEAGMNLASAAAHFGVSEQTIYNWRSTRGVADSKVNWVVSRMREFLASKAEKELPDRLTLEVSREQFDGWSHAALADGKILRDWALHTLDEAAAEHTELSQSQDPVYLPLAKVAEEGNEYHSSSAERAKDGETSHQYEDEGAA